MEQTIEWLISTSPLTDYRTRLDLLHQPETDTLVITARKTMLENPLITSMIKEITNWPGTLLVSHKSAGHSLHKLVFLAEIGLTVNDPGMQELISRVMEHQDSDGPFEMLTNIPTHFGGTGEDVWSWALCDAPSLLYALVKFGLGDDPRVNCGIEYLSGLVRENGFPCAGSTKLGTFRGPGRKIDPCPYANLIMVKLLSSIPEYCDSDACHKGAESILKCWAERQTFHPYIFYMGNDFCKLKAPLVWFDIIHVSFVLSQLPWIKGDQRLEELKALIAQKADAEGRFTQESIWTAWKGWDFGQKKVPSPYLTFLATKILSD
ncbi:MAG: hypothetical protein CVU45_00595 [Chloroflexi bacterium HGW-Chloroflexi-7]|nr:MAG: hypothetical protein CVU45_00595 [Chloroflexi bacterium HGW-Chloroflexi-7]